MQNVNHHETELQLLEPFHDLATTVDNCAKFSLNLIVESIDKLKVEMAHGNSFLQDSFNQMSSIPENNTLPVDDAMSFESLEWDSISIRCRERSDSSGHSELSTERHSRSSAGRHSSGRKSNQHSRASSVAGKSTHSSGGSSHSSLPGSQVAEFERLRSEMVNAATKKALKTRCSEAIQRGAQSLRRSDEADWNSQVAHVRRGCGGRTIQGVLINSGQRID
eukprot:750132-Hanusia_phi.AAC.1